MKHQSTNLILFLAAICAICLPSTGSAQWESIEAHEQYMDGVRKLHAEGVKPPAGSKFIGIWTRENDARVYTFKADGSMTITKASGEVIEKGAWVHAREKDAKDELAIYKTGKSVAKVFPHETQIVISRGDLFEILSRVP